MSVYTGVTIPASPALVTPVVPEFKGGALVPGPPCPCLETPIPLYIEARNYYVTMTKCSGFPSVRTTTTTYTKDEKPSDLTEEEEESWDAAWGPTITHTTEDKLARDYSKFETWNLGSVDQSRSESGFCEFIRTKDEWTPGELDANPGYATYTPTTEIEETEPADVPAADLSADFEGEFESGLGNGYSTAMDDDGDSSTGSKIQWRWVIDLTNWPASREWPDGLVIEGRVVWHSVTTTISNDDDLLEPIRETSVQSEPFSIEKSDPIWRGDARVSEPFGAPGRGKSRVEMNFVPAAFAHLLPFE
jgi:hypothetical protein